MQFEAKMKVERGKKYIKKILLYLKNKKEKKYLQDIFKVIWEKNLFSFIRFVYM